MGAGQECNFSEKGWQILHGFLRKKSLHHHALWVCVSVGPSAAWTASIQFDTEGQVSKISSPQKFKRDWYLQSELTTYQTLGNLYKNVIDAHKASELVV